MNVYLDRCVVCILYAYFVQENIIFQGRFGRSIGTKLMDNKRCVAIRQENDIIITRSQRSLYCDLFINTKVYFSIYKQSHPSSHILQYLTKQINLILLEMVTTDISQFKIYIQRDQRTIIHFIVTIQLYIPTVFLRFYAKNG